MARWTRRLEEGQFVNGSAGTEQRGGVLTLPQATDADAKDGDLEEHLEDDKALCAQAL